MEAEITIGQMFDCRVARRGKGAKGSVEAQTFGMPVNDEKGIAKKFDYSHSHSWDTTELIEKIAELGNVNEILLRGADFILKSAAIKSQATTSMLQARLIKEGVAKDKKEAKSMALAMTTMQNQIVKMNKMGYNYPVPTLDELIAKTKEKK